MSEKQEKKHYNDGRYYLSIKEYRKAITEFTQAIALNTDYRDKYKRPIEGESLLPEYHFYRGNAKAKLGDDKGALRDYQTLLQLFPEPSEKIQARTYCEIGIIQCEKEQYQEALANCNQAEKLNPDDAKIYYARGNIRLALKEYQKAIDNYTKSIKLGANEAVDYYQRAVAYRLLGKETEALAESKESQEKEALETKALELKGKAIADFRIAQELDPTIIAREETKEVKKDVRQIRDFQTPLEELKKDYEKMKKNWLKASCWAMGITLFIILAMPLLNIFLGETEKIPITNQIAISLAFSVVTSWFSFQYSNAKKLYLQTINNIARAKMFQYIKDDKEKTYENFISTIDAILPTANNSTGMNKNHLIEILQQAIKTIKGK